MDGHPIVYTSMGHENNPNALCEKEQNVCSKHDYNLGHRRCQTYNTHRMTENEKERNYY